MGFSFINYKNILSEFLKNNYDCVDYFSQISDAKQFLLRHDIDIDLFNCENMSKIEVELNLKATYFFQPNNDYYNPLSKEGMRILNQLSLNHDIGLHIDPLLFRTEQELNERVIDFYEFYKNYCNIKKTFSFHRPGKYITNPSIKIEGFVNAYDEYFLNNMQYVSDSNRRPFFEQEPFFNALKESKSIMVLTHPIWWHEQSLSPEELIQYLYEQTKKNICNKALSENIRLFTDYFN